MRRSSVRRPLLIALLLVVASLVVWQASEHARWPYVVALGGGPHAALVTEPYGCAPVASVPASPVAGTVRASDFFLGSIGDYVYADLPTGPRWVRAELPVTPEERAFLVALAGDHPSCVSVLVRPFAGGRHVAVELDEGIFVVDLVARRARLLDPRRATLENCRMSTGRETLDCWLDLTLGAARFDPEGHELEGTFVPAWTR